MFSFLHCLLLFKISLFISYLHIPLITLINFSYVLKLCIEKTPFLRKTSAKKLKRGTAAAITIQKKKFTGSHVLIETLVIDNPSQNIKLTVVTYEKKQLNLTWNPWITFDEITTECQTSMKTFLQLLDETYFFSTNIVRATWILYPLELTNSRRKFVILTHNLESYSLF